MARRVVWCGVRGARGNRYSTCMIVCACVGQTLAPPATEHESKRRDFIDNEEGKLLSKMGVLRQQTLAKNREFKRQTVRDRAGKG